MADQWTGLAASRGPIKIPTCTHGTSMMFRCDRCADSKRAYIDGKARGQRECARTHQPMQDAAYRAGELAGMVKVGAVVGAHSRKPEAFFDLVESVSPGPYLELFARPPHRLGRDVWGNESANTASMDPAV